MPATLAELARVLRPDGPLHFLEHVRAPGRWHGAVQDAVTPLWKRLGAGCCPNRRTHEVLLASGWRVQALRRVQLPATLGITSPGIVGTALPPRAAVQAETHAGL